MYLASVCRSLQCLISALTQAGGGGLLFRFALFSCVPGREVRCRQRSLACVGRSRSVPATLGLPPLTVCVLSPSTLLRLQAALQGAGPELRAVPVFGYSTNARTDSVGPVFCPFLSRSSSGSQELDERTLPSAVHLIPSRVPASVSRHASRVILVSLLGT